MVLINSTRPQHSLPSISNTISEPIFLVGAERSGTTMLRLMLSHHPQIAWCNEFEYAVDRISDTGGFPELDHYYEWLEIHRIFNRTGFQIDRRLNYPQLVNSFLRQKQEKTEKPIIGATVHRHFDKLLKIWPNARFIHIVRDPRDVSRSCIGMGWAGNVWTGVERWVDAEQIWDKLAAHVPPERRIELKYETLISEPIQTLTPICEFIGVPFDEAILQYSETTTYSSPDPDLIYQWRRKMSDYEIQLVELQVGSLLGERGYESSGLPTLSMTPIHQKQLRFHDWWQRWQFRVKRYGWSVCLSDYLARFFHLKSLEKRLRLHINAIDQTYLK